MRKNNVSLRLQQSLLDEVRELAKTEGVAINQFINVAVAEKVSALRTETYFRERRERGDPEAALAILRKAGRGKPLLPGDALLEED